MRVVHCPSFISLELLLYTQYVLKRIVFDFFTFLCLICVRCVNKYRTHSPAPVNLLMLAYTISRTRSTLGSPPPFPSVARLPPPEKNKHSTYWYRESFS